MQISHNCQVHMTYMGVISQKVERIKKKQWNRKSD